MLNDRARSVDTFAMRRFDATLLMLFSTYRIRGSGPSSDNSVKLAHLRLARDCARSFSVIGLQWTLQKFGYY